MIHQFTYSWRLILLFIIFFLLLLPPKTNAFTVRGLFSRLRNRNQVNTVEQFHDLILSRRTINDFEPVLPEHWETCLERAIETAMYAPNHKRTEPWRFHLLGPTTIQQVCELNAKLVAAKKGETAGAKKLQRWLAMPGWLVVTCRKSDDDDKSTSMATDPMSLAREDYAACCCAIQNVCLSLHANGLGTKWTTGPVNFDPEFSQIVGFSPTEEYVVGTLWFGTPVAPLPKAPVKKLALKDVLIRHD